MNKTRPSGGGLYRAISYSLISIFGLLIVLFRCYIYLVGAFGRLFEVSYPLSNPLSNLRQFACPEYDEDDDQDND